MTGIPTNVQILRQQRKEKKTVMKGRYLRDASIKRLKRRRNDDGYSDFLGDEVVESKFRRRRLSSKFEDSLNSLKDGFLSSMGGRDELRKREL
jgi:hypothetical protein